MARLCWCSIVRTQKISWESRVARSGAGQGDEFGLMEVGVLICVLVRWN